MLISAETSPQIMGGKCGPALCGVECRVEPTSLDGEWKRRKHLQDLKMLK